MKPLNQKQKYRRGGIAGIIFLGSFAGVVVLIIGSLVFNELRTGLTAARADTLRAQGATIASVLAEAAVSEYPEPILDEDKARLVLKRVFREPNARMRLFSRSGKTILDTNIIDDEIAVRELKPLGPRLPDLKQATEEIVKETRGIISGSSQNPKIALQNEVIRTFNGQTSAQERIDEAGKQVVSVSVPITRVNTIVGVLTLESEDVSAIIKKERMALIPFIGAAVLANLLSATIMAWSIARPLNRLSRAAFAVQTGKINSIAEPDLIERPDEIGELAYSLNEMTQTLQERINANESFAADVAHEIKNPLAAVRNAAELLQRDLKPEQKQKLEKILLSDIGRIDKLITDISNASRLDAELARNENHITSLKKITNDLAESYSSIALNRDISLVIDWFDETDDLNILAHETAINRVLVNLLDNAISFSKPKDTIRIIGASKNNKTRLAIEDMGGGIQAESIEKIFTRFYTYRPKITETQEANKGNEGAAAFGAHSGLGLAIARQIIESHNGKLWAENVKNNGIITGARFIIELPKAI